MFGFFLLSIIFVVIVVAGGGGGVNGGSHGGPGGGGRGDGCGRYGSGDFCRSAILKPVFSLLPVSLTYKWLVLVVVAVIVGLAVVIVFGGLLL